MKPHGFDVGLQNNLFVPSRKKKTPEPLWFRCSHIAPTQKDAFCIIGSISKDIYSFYCFMLQQSNSPYLWCKKMLSFTNENQEFHCNERILHDKRTVTLLLVLSCLNNCFIDTILLFVSTCFILKMLIKRNREVRRTQTPLLFPAQV